MSKKTKVIGVCKLCLKTAELRDSHIVSKFLLRENGLVGRHQSKFDIICVTDPSQSELHQQDAIKEYLLCQSCDNEKFATWEGYARQKFYGTPSPFQGVKAPGFVWQGLDYAQMKLFFLSVLWRMGIASHQFYGHVQLGRHEKHLRRMLLAEDPMESWRYGCSVGYLHYGRKTLDAMFTQPQKFTTEGDLNCVRFVMAGFVYFMYLNNVRPSSDVVSSFLQPSGNWVVPIMQAKEIKFVWDEINLARKHYGLWTDDDFVPSPSK